MPSASIPEAWRSIASADKNRGLPASDECPLQVRGHLKVVSMLTLVYRPFCGPWSASWGAAAFHPSPRAQAAR